MARDYYMVEGTEFPGTLRGLTAAIKLAREYAQSGPVDVIKNWESGASTVAYHIPHMPAPSKPDRQGNFSREGR